MPATYQRIASAAAAHALALRGGFVLRDDDNAPACAPGQPAVSLLMIANTGPAMWHAFTDARPDDRNPLDVWTRAVVEPIAAQFGARAVYPFDTPPLPFQRWAARAWPLFPSPLGLLIDTEFGLWHALRAALLFPGVVEMPPRETRNSPCANCSAKPCLTACPVAAYTSVGFDHAACRTHVATGAGAACMTGGCSARDACPVGRQHRYSDAQVQFHMRAFAG